MAKVQFKVLENAYQAGYDAVGNAVLEAKKEDGSYIAVGLFGDEVQIDYFDKDGNPTNQKTVHLLELDEVEDAPTYEDVKKLYKQILKNEDN